MENGGGTAEKKAKDDVVVTIASTGEDMELDKKGSSSPLPGMEITEFKNLPLKVPNSTFAGSPPAMAKFSPDPTPNKPQKITTEPTRSISTTSFSKPKSRFSEPPSPKLADEKTTFANPNSPNLGGSPESRVQVTGSVDKKGDDEGVYNCTDLKVRVKKVGVLMLFEWTVFVCIMGVLISTLTLDILKDKVIWGLRLWKWCVLVLAIFCGRLFTGWSINVMLYLIEKNFLLKEKVLYFVYGVKTSVRVFIWLSLVLLVWVLLINRGVERSKDTSRILSYITRALGALLVGAAIWMLKTLFVKAVASHYQCSRFFERIKESIFHQHVVKILSLPKTTGTEGTGGKSICCKGILRFINTKKEKEVKIDVEKLNGVKHGKVSTLTFKRLVDIIRGSGLSIFSNTPKGYDDENGEQHDEKIGSKKQAEEAADQIFKNVVAKPDAENMEKDDLLCFLKKKEVDTMLNYFGASEKKKIERSQFTAWLVDAYVERKSLTHSLNDAKTAIEELNRLLSAIVLILAVIVWLLMMGFLTTQIIVLISSQLLLAAFMFGNAAKTVFEAIIFVFVMHPFDVHDRCVIDGVQMVVEDMNILTTIFLRFDGEMIFYPNSVLSTKPISNYKRSPEMGDSVLFDVHISTPAEKIMHLEKKIKDYLVSKSDDWKPECTLLVKEIENVNKMKMVLYVTHTMNFQEYLQKSVRRSKLVLEMKKYFEELKIEYSLLPLEVKLSNNGKPATTFAG